MLVKIEKLIYGGDGIGHQDDATIFVPFVLPGEEVEIGALAVKKKFRRGKAARVLAPSHERAQPGCPHFSVCGACHYQHIAYQAQLRFKQEILRETLRHLGRIDWPAPITVHPSPPWSYRNRAQWKIRELRQEKETGATDRPGIGYFRAGSFTLCPIQECPILSPLLLETLKTLRRSLTEGVLSPRLREIEVFADPEERELLMNVSCSSLPVPTATFAKELFRLLPHLRSLFLRDIRGERLELIGPGFLSCAVDKKNFRVGHLSFFQVNRYLLTEIVQSTVAAAGGGDVAFDLFAGVGLFASFLADRFSRVVAVEADPASARDLAANTSSGGERIEACNTAAADFLRGWKLRHGNAPPDAVIVDPPRAGLDAETIEALADVSARRVVYVSCDPSTLARDLARLCADRYQIGEIHLLDMFPQTFHIETVVRLDQKQ